MDAADLALIRASNKANDAFTILYIHIYYMLTWASEVRVDTFPVDIMLTHSAKKYHLTHTSRLETPRLCSFG